MSLYHASTCTPLPSGEGLPRTAEPLSLYLAISHCQSLHVTMERCTYMSLTFKRIGRYPRIDLMHCSYAPSSHRRRPTWHSVGGNDHHDCLSCFHDGQACFSRHGKYMAFRVMLQRAVMPKCCSSHSRRATWPPSTWRSKARSHDADYS